MREVCSLSNRCRHEVRRWICTFHVTSLMCTRALICSRDFSWPLFEIQSAETVLTGCVLMAVFVSSTEEFLQKIESCLFSVRNLCFAFTLCSSACCGWRLLETSRDITITPLITGDNETLILPFFQYLCCLKLEILRHWRCQRLMIMMMVNLTTKMQIWKKNFHVDTVYDFDGGREQVFDGTFINEVRADMRWALDVRAHSALWQRSSGSYIAQSSRVWKAYAQKGLF